jgi:hypothetical protein
MQGLNAPFKILKRLHFQVNFRVDGWLSQTTDYLFGFLVLLALVAHYFYKLLNEYFVKDRSKDLHYSQWTTPCCLT